MSASKTIIGLDAIAEAMGLPAYRARQLLDDGAVRREWRLDGVFVTTREAIDAWLRTDQAWRERAAARLRG